jgi:iron complex transport system ATP-binding protein
MAGTDVVSVLHDLVAEGAPMGVTIGLQICPTARRFAIVIGVVNTSDTMQLLADEAIGLTANRRRAVLGIAGSPGAGKSTLVEQLLELIAERMGSDWVAHVPMDGFDSEWHGSTQRRSCFLRPRRQRISSSSTMRTASRFRGESRTPARCMRNQRWARENARESLRYGRWVPDSGSDSVDPDLLIDFARVTLRRGGQVLVGPVTWSVELDERWVVIGPNGAGKTSLLRIAAALEHPSSGTAYVLGERLGRTDMAELRSRVGLSSSALSQRVPDGELVRDLVVSAGYAVLGRWREEYEDVDYEQAIDMLESVGAEHLAERTYETLSEGERKRVLIARSLMTDPELLLLDEPAAGLDLGGREELVARLEDLAADPDAPAIVLVTHHVEEIPRGFSHALILSEGRVVDSGLLTDVLTAENLSKAFGQSIALDFIDGRFFARRTRTRAAHRRRG